MEHPSCPYIRETMPCTLVLHGKQWKERRGSEATFGAPCCLCWIYGTHSYCLIGLTLTHLGSTSPSATFRFSVRLEGKDCSLIESFIKLERHEGFLISSLTTRQPRLRCMWRWAGYGWWGEKIVILLWLLISTLVSILPTSQQPIWAEQSNWVFQCGLIMGWDACSSNI